MYITRGIETIRQCEEKLRSLVAEAAGAGDYAAVIRLTNWAKELGALNPVLPAPPILETLPPRKVLATDYPKFYRRGEELVKIGWSKREKKEYHHKSPHAALKALSQAIAKISKDGRIFTTDELLPVRDPNDNSDVPDYQAYVALALLKQVGLVDQHGRRGYSLPQNAEFLNAVESTWQKLPER